MASRVPQPADWNELLQKRDGKDSGASVIMYVAKEPKVSGASDKSDSRTVYTAVPGHMKTVSNSTIATIDNDDKSIDAREVLVVAKRGKDASYVQDGSELAMPIRNLLRRMTWQEIKEEGLYLPGEEDPCAHL
jgi:hypothetical protein